MTAVERPTLAEIKSTWPPAIDLTRLALALGVSRSTVYEAVRSERCPVKVIRVGCHARALTSDLVRVLENGTAGH